MTDTTNIYDEQRMTIYAIFTDMRLEIEHKQPAKVYAESAHKIEALIAAHTNELLNNFLAELPKTKELAPNGMSERIGFNQAIDQVTKLIESKKL